jgi:hypothetical protein
LAIENTSSCNFGNYGDFGNSGNLMNPPNPVTQGFRIAWRKPSLWVWEILWRWAFGLTALALLFYAYRVLSGSILVTDTDALAWRNRDVMALAASLAQIIEDDGSVLLSLALRILPAITVLWLVLSSFGRYVTLNSLVESREQLSLRSVFWLQTWRVLSMWLGTFVLIATIGIEGELATRGEKTDFVLYYIMVLPSLLVIAIVWSIVNWYLALAPVCLCAGARFAWSAIRLAVALGRSHRPEFASASFLSLLLRVAGIMIAFVLCVVTSGWMGPAPRAYTTLVVVVSLAYFAFADFLFAARQASFVEIAVRPPQIVVTDGVPASKSSAAGFRIQ